MLLTLNLATNLLANDIGANYDPALRINLVCEKYMNECDPPGSLERVRFVVTADVNGEGFISLPPRYQAIRGAVENPIENAPCGFAIPIRNGWYEYTVGNLGMLKSSNPMMGIIPIPKSAPTDAVKYKVPACPAQGSQTFFTCICKLAFQLLEDDDDVLPIQNINALRKGLKALSKEDASDTVRSEQLWAQGKVELNSQKDNYDGAQSQGKVQFDDDFEVGCLTEGYGYGHWR